MEYIIVSINSNKVRKISVWIFLIAVFFLLVVLSVKTIISVNILIIKFVFVLGLISSLVIVFVPSYREIGTLKVSSEEIYINYNRLSITNSDIKYVTLFISSFQGDIKKERFFYRFYNGLDNRLKTNFGDFNILLRNRKEKESLTENMIEIGVTVNAI